MGLNRVEKIKEKAISHALYQTGYSTDITFKDLLSDGRISLVLQEANSIWIDGKEPAFNRDELIESDLKWYFDNK